MSAMAASSRARGSRPYNWRPGPTRWVSVRWMSFMAHDLASFGAGALETTGKRPLSPRAGAPRLGSFRQQCFHILRHLRQCRRRRLGFVDDGLQVIVDGVGDLEGVLSREGVPAGDHVLLPDRDQVIGILLIEA